MLLAATKRPRTNARAQCEVDSNAPSALWRFPPLMTHGPAVMDSVIIVVLVVKASRPGRGARKGGRDGCDTYDN